MREQSGSVGSSGRILLPEHAWRRDLFHEVDKRADIWRLGEIDRIAGQQNVNKDIPFAARDGFKENVLRMLLQVGPQDTVEARLLRQTWPVRTSLNYFVKLLGERHASFLDQATGLESASVPQSRL
jgi:hypothetical protein